MMLPATALHLHQYEKQRHAWTGCAEMNAGAGDGRVRRKSGKKQEKEFAFRPTTRPSHAVYDMGKNLIEFVSVIVSLLPAAAAERANDRL